MFRAVLYPFVIAAIVGACSTPASAGRQGIASYYHDSLAGNTTANGETYDPDALTCAHRSLPFGTKVEIEVVATGAIARCRINDRGPFVRGRIIDVSRAIAKRLGFFGKKGVARVRVRILE